MYTFQQLHAALAAHGAKERPCALLPSNLMGAFLDPARDTDKSAFLTQRLKVVGLDIGTKPRQPQRRKRKPTLASALKQARRAGQAVKGAEVYPDRVVLQFGEPGTEANDLNEWDKALRRDTH